MTMQQKLRNRVLAIVAQIPKGHVMTYKQVAAAAGSPRAARAVGNILNKNYDPAIPCHRVVRSDGTAGEYNRGARRKVALLHAEGVKLHFTAGPASAVQQGATAGKPAAPAPPPDSFARAAGARRGTPVASPAANGSGVEIQK